MKPSEKIKQCAEREEVKFLQQYNEKDYTPKTSKVAGMDRAIEIISYCLDAIAEKLKLDFE